jgi:hypothetical protein
MSRDCEAKICFPSAAKAACVAGLTAGLKSRPFKASMTQVSCLRSEGV